MDNNHIQEKDLGQTYQLFSGLSILFLLAASLLIGAYFIYEITHAKPDPALAKATKRNYSSGSYAAASTPNVWLAPSPNSIPDDEQGQLIHYGRKLISNTAEYLGPKGAVAQISNGLNCQNCHLQAGTVAFGNNYGGVYSTYPKIRPRSETKVNVPQRINACFKRSLNGQPLPLDSKEMKAMVAYMEWLGKDVPQGKKPAGAGLAKINYLDRPADPLKGKDYYLAECARCHGEDGQGKFKPNGKSYEYPPLWGPHAYNVSAGLYRVEKFARFIKTNMPYGVSWKNPILSDEEAWDIAAYVNSQPHPNTRFAGDWPNLFTKAIDSPFGPYADSFSEKEHKYGPYPPIKAELEQLKKSKK